MYNSFISIAKRYLDITVKFVKGLVNAMFYKKIGVDVMFAKKVEITTKFEGTRQ